MRRAPSLRPGLVGETPDLQAVGPASLVAAWPQQRDRARANGERHGLVEGRLVLQNRIGLAAAYIKGRLRSCVIGPAATPLCLQAAGLRRRRSSPARRD